MLADEFYDRIKHLLLASTSPAGSKSSAWPQGMPYWPIDLSGMQGLESLTFIGRAPDADLLEGAAATCTGLTSLVLGLEPQDSLVLPPGEKGNSLTTRYTGVNAIAKMKSLRRLSLAVEDDAWDWDDEDCGPSAQLLTLTRLTGLTELRMGGAAVSAESARAFLRAAQDLRRVALVFDAMSGKIHERRDLALWRQLQHVELRLQGRLLESDIPLLALGLSTSLHSLHLSSCSVSPYSLTALASLAALKELSIGSLQTVGLPAAADAEEGAAATAVRGALVGLLTGPLGKRLEVLRVELSGSSEDIYNDFPRLTDTWAHGSLRVLHLAHANAYSLSSTGALANLAGLSSLRDLRVSVEGQACRDNSALRAAWLPPNLTCLELAGIHLPCGEEELRDANALQRQQQKENDSQGHCEQGASGTAACARSARETHGSAQCQGLEAPALAGAGGHDCGGSGRSGDDARCGHARLQSLQRLSLHSCRFGCCGHLKAALGPAVVPQLSSLDLDDVGGLAEEHLPELAALTGLTSLAVCALGHSSISSSSMAHVSGLVGLRRLRWHAGDSLDAPPHPAMLKPLKRLASLDVSSGQWWRMSRWHVATALGEELPLCELAVS